MMIMITIINNSHNVTWMYKKNLLINFDVLCWRKNKGKKTNNKANFKKRKKWIIDVAKKIRWKEKCSMIVW